MKIYVAAILVFSDLKDTSGESPSEGTYSECIPALIPANSIEEAAEDARVQAFERWKPSEGWHTHQLNILPVTALVSQMVFSAADACTLDEGPDGEGVTFTYDPDGRLR